MARRTFWLNAAKLKSVPKLRSAFKHNLREDDREYALGNNIDPLRKHLNVIMAGAETSEAIIAMHKALWNAATSSRLKKDGSRIKVRHDAVQAIEFVLSLQVNSGIDEARFFQKALEWIVQRYCVPVLSAIIHRDEGDGHPHMHVIVLPIRDGAMIGSAMLGLYATMQASFHSEVAVHFNLTYEVRLDTESRHRAANMVMAALQATPELTTTNEFQAWLFGAILRNPSRPLELIGLQMPVPQPATKKWVETMTRPMKPPRPPLVKAKPIGFAANHHQHTQLAQAKPSPVLGFVLALPMIVADGVCNAEPPPVDALYIEVDHDNPTPSRPSRDECRDLYRVSDDLPAHWFDECTGEFVQPSQARQSNKARIVAAVSSTLLKVKA